jgi:hypothetical protein
VTHHRTPPTGRLGGALAALVACAVLAVACAPPSTPPTPPGPGPLTSSGKATLREVKRSHYSAQLQSMAREISNGAGAPLVAFTVESSPPSIFVNWPVPDDRADAFAAQAAIPPAFELAKVRIVESDPEPRYWLSLNIYRVSGVTTGLRAEWSTYVDDGDGVPRFMILRARAAEGSLDPIGPLALPEPFSHRQDPDGTIRTSMRRTELVGGVPVLGSQNLFSATIPVPPPAEQELVEPTDEWVTTNDFIYWVNGVNDRTYYDASAHGARLVSVDLDEVSLADDSEWAPFLDPPAHVLVYQNELRFVISPWWNVTEVDGRVAPATVASLASLKRTIYGGMTNQMALGVKAGLEEPTVRSTVRGDAPSVHWHWRIDPSELPAFAAAVGLPPGLSLAPVPLQAGDAPAHWLSLHVHERTGEGAGRRAEWTTHVSDGDGVAELVLGARGSERTLDPVSLFSPPHPVSQSVDAGVLHTEVGSGAAAFTSTFAVPTSGGPTVQASRTWIAAGDRRYWRNGVADRVLYDGGRFQQRTAIDPASVTVQDGGPWSAFTAGGPDRVWLDTQALDMAITPWWNLSRL